tara:strand:+ start:38 stop:481 length:444 start_codon:yes stop_codon:yes gene_type:complete
MNFLQFLSTACKLSAPFPDPYGEWLGYTVADYKKKIGEVETELLITQEHLSPSGSVHGGVISGFLDFSCGCASFLVIPENTLCSTVDLNVKYFSPMKAGDKAVATAKIIHQGRSLCTAVAHMFLDHPNEKLVATAMATFNVYAIPKV